MGKLCFSIAMERKFGYKVVMGEKEKERKGKRKRRKIKKKEKKRNRECILSFL